MDIHLVESHLANIRPMCCNPMHVRVLDDNDGSGAFKHKDL